MAPRKSIYLIDGMAIAYRSFYAFIQRPLINSKGMNTSALYGFLTFLQRLMDKFEPDILVAVFDTKAPTFRHHLFKDYKANRQQMPEDLSTQIDPLKQLIRAYGIPVLEIDGYEADDIIGSYSVIASKYGFKSFLVTPDKDYCQLVNETTVILKPGYQATPDEIIDRSGVIKKFGIPPEQIVDYLALVGDKTDNVPGIPGIGEKTALPLIREYHTLENIFNECDKIPQKGVRDKLESHKELGILSKSLVTIRTDMKDLPDINKLHREEINKEKLSHLLDLYELKQFQKKLLQQSASSVNNLTIPGETSGEIQAIKTINETPHNYILVTSVDQLHIIEKRAHAQKYFVFDTETTSLNVIDTTLLGVALSFSAHEAFFIPVIDNTNIKKGQPDSLFSGTYSSTDRVGILLDEFTSILGPLFSNTEITKIAHNAKFDISVLYNKGIKVRGPIFDTMIASYVVRQDGKHNLDALALEQLRYRTISFEDLVGSGKNQVPLTTVSIDKLCEYSCEDADVTYQLYHLFSDILRQQNKTLLCDKIEFPLIYVLVAMELTGVALDTPFLSQMSIEIERAIKALTKTIFMHAGKEFNINSTQQLAQILYKDLLLPTSSIKKTKTGYSTDVDALESLKDRHPIISDLLHYRQLMKLKSTYVDALPQLITEKTGRVHTSFNQTVTSTGRLSSSEPNFQNIPIRTDYGRMIRKAFIPGFRGWKIIAADYSQIELRLMAHISGDPAMKDAFLKGEDIHSTTASEVFAVPFSEITKDMRRKAKEVNFGIIYGIAEFGLASRLEISRTEARAIISTYFQRFPKVKEYIHSTIDFARRKGYVETLLGRRRYLPDINSRNQTIRQAAERQAINMPIQGTAADMIKLAMINVYRALGLYSSKANLLLQVHDELVLEAHSDVVDAMKALLKKEMSEALPLDIPVVVDIGVGENWLEAH